ncbi:MAG: hypothetical protein QME51_06810, partial [Planctomycetota bacterium]|nr:hypothetical protein [Planctomycetota bacterium]
QFKSNKPVFIDNRPVTVSEQDQIKRALKLDWTSPEKELQTIDRVLKSKQRKIATDLYQNDKHVDLINRIKQAGGIKPYAGGAEAEEYLRNVPVYLRNKNGLAPDEMASSLGLAGDYMLYEKTSQLPLAVPKIEEFMTSAGHWINDFEKELVTRKEIMQVLTNAGLGNPSGIPSSVSSKLLSKILKTEITPSEASELLKGAKEESNLATKMQKWQAVKIKGEIGLNDKAYYNIMENLTGKKSLSQFKKNPMTEAEADGFVRFLQKIPIKITSGTRNKIIGIMAERRMTPLQMKRLEKMFEIRSPKTPMTELQAQSLIKAMEKIPKTKFGEPPVIFKGMPAVSDDAIKAIQEGGDLNRSYLDVNRAFQAKNQLFDEITDKINPALKKEIQLPIRYGVNDTAKEGRLVLKEIRDMFKGVSDGGKKRIMKHLLSKEEDGRKVLSAMGETAEKLSLKENAVVRWMKEKYDSAIVRINKAEQRSGLAITPKRPDYVTHMREENTLGDMLMDVTAGETNKMIKQGIHRKAPAWQYGRRKDLMSSVNLDAQEVITQYLMQSTKRIHLAEPISKARKLLKYIQVEKPVIHGRINGMLDYLTSGKLVSMGVGDGLDVLTGWVRRNVPAAMLEFNLRSALIQPTAIKNVLVEVSPKAVLRGFTRYLSKEGRSFIENESRVLAARTPELFSRQSPIIGRLLGKRAEEILGKAHDTGMFLLTYLDGETALMSWAMGYEEALLKGLKGIEAVTFADDLLLRTNMSAAPDVISPFMTTHLGRTVGALQTYQLGEWNFLIRNVLGISRKMPVKERVLRTAKFLAGITAVNMIMEDALGIYSPFPRPIKTFMDIRKKKLTTGQGVWEIVKEMGGELPLLGGLRYGSSILGPVWKLGEDFYGLLDKDFKGFAEKGQRQLNWYDWAGRVLGVPGTTQINKIFNGLDKETLQQFPYTQPERIRMMLFGSTADKKNQLRRMIWEINSNIKGYEGEMLGLARKGLADPERLEQFNKKRNVVIGYYGALREVYGELWTYYTDKNELEKDLKEDDPMYFSDDTKEEQVRQQASVYTLREKARKYTEEMKKKQGTK